MSIKFILLYSTLHSKSDINEIATKIINESFSFLEFDPDWFVSRSDHLNINKFLYQYRHLVNGYEYYVIASSDAMAKHILFNTASNNVEVYEATR